MFITKVLAETATAQISSGDLIKDALMVAGVGLVGVFAVLCLFYITIKIMQFKKK